MATMVELGEFLPWDGCIFVFRVTGSSEVLSVENFYNGIATIRCEEGDESYISAQTIAGCFDEKSNFASELCKIFPNDDETMQTDKLEAIHLKICYGGMTIEIKKHNG